MTKILNNVNIISKIYDYCSLETKISLKKVLEEENLGAPLEHYIKQSNKKYPCFVCILELVMFYISDGTAWPRFHAKRVLITGFEAVRYCIKCCILNIILD